MGHRSHQLVPGTDACDVFSKLSQAFLSKRVVHAADGPGDELVPFHPVKAFVLRVQRPYPLASTSVGRYGRGRVRLKQRKQQLRSGSADSTSGFGAAYARAAVLP